MKTYYIVDKSGRYYIDNIVGYKAAEAILQKIEEEIGTESFEKAQLIIMPTLMNEERKV